MADTQVLGTCVERRGGSSPLTRTFNNFDIIYASTVAYVADPLVGSAVINVLKNKLRVSKFPF